MTTKQKSTENGIKSAITATESRCFYWALFRAGGQHKWTVAVLRLYTWWNELLVLLCLQSHLGDTEQKWAETITWQSQLWELLWRLQRGSFPIQLCSASHWRCAMIALATFSLYWQKARRCTLNDWLASRRVGSFLYTGSFPAQLAINLQYWDMTLSDTRDSLESSSITSYVHTNRNWVLVLCGFKTASNVLKEGTGNCSNINTCAILCSF